MNLSHQPRGTTYKLVEWGTLWCDKMAVMRKMRDGEECSLNVEKLLTTSVWNKGNKCKRWNNLCKVLNGTSGTQEMELAFISWESLCALHMVRTQWSCVSHHHVGGLRSEHEQGRVSFLSVKPSHLMNFTSFPSPSLSLISYTSNAAVAGMQWPGWRQGGKTQNLVIRHKDEQCCPKLFNGSWSLQDVNEW